MFVILLILKFEGFSFVICELFLCVIFVISFDVKYSLREFIKEYEMGMFVEFDDIEMFVESIIYLYDNLDKVI